ncbi:hypothetical protein IBX76_05410 [Neisseria gonorrhoeae]|uniref:hypothetical protein n=1 Tax=Neisseria gonorrhoeae TaxID=485 RepID=UPI00177B9141|nr:hypothetical protein [Neisseria gonorrhoeae]QOG38774.1 hypothetical protein IBX76_05410 [Neisseria gonorrhoeae]
MAYFGGFVRALFDLGVFERGGGKGREMAFPRLAAASAALCLMCGGTFSVKLILIFGNCRNIC